MALAINCLHLSPPPFINRKGWGKEKNCNHSTTPVLNQAPQLIHYSPTNYTVMFFLSSFFFAVEVCVLEVHVVTLPERFLCVFTLPPPPRTSYSIHLPVTYNVIYGTAVGAYQPHTRELDSALMQFSAVIVDSRAGASKESGDVILSKVLKC